MRHEFFDTFKFAAISLIRILSPNIKRKKYAQKKEKKREKNQKVSFLGFWAPFWSPNEASLNDPRAYVLAEVGAVKRKKRKGETKREIEAQRELEMTQKGAQIMGRA